MNMSFAFLRIALPCLLLLPSISFAQAIPTEEEIELKYFQGLPKEVVERNLKAFWDCSWAGPDDNFNGAGVCTWNNNPDRKLAQRRIQMRKNNLFSGYVNDVYPKREKPCTAEEKKWRTADGSCNYETQEKAYAGSAGARFGRLSKPDSAQPETDKLLVPSPRKVSLGVLTRKDFKAVLFLNLFATAWIQFMIHDWFDHGEPDPDMSKAIQMPVDQDDPWAQKYELNWDAGQKTLVVPVPRTRQDLSAEQKEEILAKLVPETPLDGKGVPRNQYKVHQNTVTAWWDLGQIYGNDDATQKQLRSFEGGKLKVRADGLLPLKQYRHNGHPSYTEESGFTKNWWVGLSLLHHLFVREHNYIAEQLGINLETRQKKKTRGDSFDESDADFDKRTFQTARLINSAVMAKIHTNEWTPAILANPTMYWGMHGNWYGYKRDCGPAETFTEKFYRIFDPMLLRFDKREIMGATGRVGEKMQDYGTTYTFPEEFVSVYRMHPLLPDQFTVREHYSGQVLRKIPIANLRDGDTTKLIYGDDYAVDRQKSQRQMLNLMYSMGQELPGQLVADNYPNVLQNIELPVRANNPQGHVMVPMDLASIDILRDRERGVPRYNQFRKNLHLRPIPDFRWLSNDQDLNARLRKAYNNKIEDLDLFVGAMAESYRPAGFGFAETLFQLFVLTASRRLETDKFFTSHFKKEYYTQFGMNYINGINGCDQGRTMSSIIKTHFPELSNAVDGPNNPFRPWKDASKGSAL